MRLVVNIFHVFKAHELIATNKFLKKVLRETSAGSWAIETDSTAHVQEITRIFKANRVKHVIKKD